MNNFRQCKLCLRSTELCKSHAIPNAFFKKIFRKNSGKAVLLGKAEDKIRNSSDSWAEPQLCKACEALLNDCYDKESIRIIESIASGYIQKSDVTVIQANPDILIKFCLSLVWRAANSSTYGYSDFQISDSDSEVIRNIILHNTTVRQSSYSVRITKLIDSTKNGFSVDLLNELIVAPFTYQIESKLKICQFAFHGLAFYVFIGRQPKEVKSKLGTLTSNKSRIIIPSEEIMRSPQLVLKLGSERNKYDAGHTTIQV